MGKPIAPPSKKSVRIIVQLNDRWRVVDAPPNWPPQWILQRKKGAASRKRTGWVGEAFCITREALERNIREHCGPVDPIAMATIDALPARQQRQKSSGHNG